MRKNPKTIKLAEIRRYLRQAANWKKTDNGMPNFYTSENYKHSRKVKNPSDGHYPYYVKSDRAINEIAEKIYKICKT